MTNSTELTTFAVKSYRYLRLAIVVVVMAVLASVLIERFQASCWQGSISAYFYTPAQSVFVGALFAVGVSLIAIKGSTDSEDMLLDVAGVLAPIVAFVPTSPPGKGASCTSSAPFFGGDTEPFINNNVLALAIGGGIAILLTVVLALVMGKATVRTFDRGSVVGAGLGIALLVIGLVWYGFFRDSFLNNAHGGAAIAMFVLLWIVMLINAFTVTSNYRYWYAGTAIAMAVFAVAVVVGKLIDGDWEHQILWLEILELGAFAIYWAAQTFEHWEGGVPTGDERAVRAAEGPIARMKAARAPADAPIG